MVVEFLLVPADLSKKCELVKVDYDCFLSSMYYYINTYDLVFRYSEFKSNDLVLCCDRLGEARKPSKRLNMRASYILRERHEFLHGDVLIGCVEKKNSDIDIIPFPRSLYNDLISLFDLFLLVLSNLSIKFFGGFEK